MNIEKDLKCGKKLQLSISFINNYYSKAFKLFLIICFSIYTILELYSIYQNILNFIIDSAHSE